MKIGPEVLKVFGRYEGRRADLELAEQIADDLAGLPEPQKMQLIALLALSIVHGSSIFDEAKKALKAGTA